MRVRALFVLSALTVGAAACATAEAPAPAPAPAEPPSAGGAPSPIDGYDWFFHADGDEAGLTYGLDESDDVWLGISCRRGGGRLDLQRPAASDDPPVIALESGGETEVYPARSEPSELHEGVFLIGEAPTSDPVFQRFRRTGWLALYGEADRSAMVPHPGSIDRIERFFAFCG